VIGDIVRVDACFGFPMPAGGNILDEALGGGAYFDACPYPISAARMILGEPSQATCRVTMDETLKVPTRADMVLQFPTGTSALVSSIFGAYYQSYYDILGTKGRIRTERAFPVPKEREVKLFLSRNDTIEELVIPPADHFRLMVEDFCSEILKGESSTAPYERELLAQARVLDAGKRSFEQNTTVTI